MSVLKEQKQQLVSKDKCTGDTVSPSEKSDAVKYGNVQEKLEKAESFVCVTCGECFGSETELVDHKILVHGPILN